MVNPYFAVYGNPRSFYGNIQLADAPKPLNNYGGWPKGREKYPPIQDTAYREPEEVVLETVEPHIEESNVKDNIAIIRKLRAELAATEDTALRIAIRDKIEKEKQEKIRKFKLAAQRDEEEAMFILF